MLLVLCTYFKGIYQYIKSSIDYYLRITLYRSKQLRVLNVSTGRHLASAYLCKLRGDNLLYIHILTNKYIYTLIILHKI